MVVQMGGRAAAAERQRSLGHGGREIEEEEEKEEEEEGRQGEGGSGLQAYGANRAQTVIGGRTVRKRAGNGTYFGGSIS